VKQYGALMISNKSISLKIKEKIFWSSLPTLPLLSAAMAMERI